MLATALKYIGVTACLYAGFVALLFFFQSRLLFVPEIGSHPATYPRPAAFQDFSARTKDGLTINGWYSPAKGNQHTLLFFQGNGGAWQNRAPDLMPFVEAGYGVLIAGYRGYGGNAGTPSEQGLYNDAQAYIAALNIDPSRIVLYGESLGTGIAIEMARRTPAFAALILEAPFTSIPDVAAVHYGFVPFIHNLVHHRFASIEKTTNLKMPKLVLLAKDDAVTPNAISQRLHDALPTPKTIKTYAGATHNTIRQAGGTKDALEFLSDLDR